MTETDELDHLQNLYDRRESKMQGGTFAGLEYDTELVSSQGVLIVLYVTDQTPQEQIERAKTAARNERDVVRFEVQKIPAAWQAAESTKDKVKT